MLHREKQKDGSTGEPASFPGWNHDDPLSIEILNNTCFFVKHSGRFSLFSAFLSPCFYK